VHLPEKLLESLEGIPGYNRESFVHVHESGEQVTSVRLNRGKITKEHEREPVIFIADFLREKFSLDSAFQLQQKIPWTDLGYYLSKRPSFTFDPLFHAGCYYVQEASSMFLEQAIKQSCDLFKPLKVLDLCAAPGGKSTHIASLISGDSLLVSNEVIKSRATVLRQNMMKWGQPNVIVTNNDPRQFTALQGFFDLIVVDAPCSGSGLFRRDPEAINEWSPDNVAHCSARQKRILDDVLPALKEGGVLIYATCSYSKEEDEEVIDRIASEEKLENIPLQTDPAWNITETISPLTNSTCYRFYPDKVKGEGFFMSCFKKNEQAAMPRFKKAKTEAVSAKEKIIISDWMKVDGMDLLKQENFVFAIPSFMADDFAVLRQHLYIQSAGINAGELMRDKFIPGHGLALSMVASNNIIRTELEYEQAIKYLQRNEIKPVEKTGWQLACYKNYPLGWINGLSNRVNNYYPKEFRILKQENDSAIEK
jgi:16S rRNA C967 or C1407 C5-methylase (RsmB/RsmF family)/NOL1/NOP2/fmu family ribosome biogenesis protein